MISAVRSGSSSIGTATTLEAVTALSGLAFDPLDTPSTMTSNTLADVTLSEPFMNRSGLRVVTRVSTTLPDAGLLSLEIPGGVCSLNLAPGGLYMTP